MCGIAGYWGRGNETILQKMVDALSHRGPDDRGMFVEGDLGLGHLRLSIVDLSATGHQPMFNATKTVGIVFNGEIFNFLLLKKEIEKTGRAFVGTSDTEVIIKLYEMYGEACFEKLVGQFAIALFDFTKKKLVLARDRMGEKPLYWSVQGGTMVFGSELGALMVSGLVKKEIDFNSLDAYVLFDYVPTPKTILRDVHKLEPATYLVYEGGTIRKQKFWSIPKEVATESEQEAIAKLDTLMGESIDGQLIADVPVGVFLSGGIDSSTVAWYAQKRSDKPINTFSIAFDDADFDESQYAQKVATLLGTNHHVKTVNAKDALSLVSKIPEVFSEPVADASVLPTLLLSQFTEESVKVSLGGDGGDELFAGYPTFQAEEMYRMFDYLPEVVKKIGRSIVRLFPAGDANFNLSFKLHKFFSSDKTNPLHHHMEWLGSFPETERSQLFSQGMSPEVNVFGSVDTFTNEYTEKDEGNRLLYAYLRSYLLDEVLVKVDRASMHYGLEVRAPFLDHRIVEFVFSLPYSFKYKQFKTKILLKKLMRGRLPDSILDRKKKGFGIPLARWLKTDLKKLCEELLSPEELTRQGIFNPDYVARLQSDHFLGRADNHKQLWNLMVFSLWYRKWL